MSEDDVGDATYKLYADIFPRLADSFSESAREQITVAMRPVQERMDQIAKSMGDTAGLEFGTKFRSRVDEAIRAVSGTVRISLDLDTSSVYAKLEAIKAGTADNINQTINITTSGLGEVRSQLDSLDTSARVTVHLDDASYESVKTRLEELGTSTEISLGKVGNAASISEIQAKSDAALAAIQARNDAALAQIQARGDLAQAKDTASLGQISAKDDAARAQIQARNDAALAQIQARNDATLAQIKARSDAAGSSSSGAPSLFATSVTLGVLAASGPVAAAALGIIPVAFGAIGVAAEKSNSEVASSFRGMEQAGKQALQQGFAPLIPTFVQISGEAKAALGTLEPTFEQASRAAAPLITTISQGFISATVIGVNGFTNALHGLQPVADSISRGVQQLAQAVGDFLSRLNATVAARGLDLLFQAVDALLPVAADLLNALIPLGNALLGLVPTIADLIHGGLDVAVPVVQALAVGIDVLGSIIDHLATPIGATTVIVLGLVYGYKLLNAAAGVAAEAMVALDVELTVAAAPLALMIAGLAGLAYVLSQLDNPDPGISIDHITGAISRLGVVVGTLPPDALKKLNNMPDPVVYGASSDFQVGNPQLNTQASVAASNTFQTALTNQVTLAKTAASATQAYSDAQYSQAASARSVDAASRGVAAAILGVADAQGQVRDAVQAVSDAQTKLTNDELAAKNTVLELTEARKAAAQALVDLRLQLTDQAASQASASFALFDAQQAAKAAGIDTLSGPVGLPTAPLTAQNEAQQKVQLALVQAQNQYNDTINTGGKLQDTANQAFAKGIENSDLVVAAQKAISSANQTVASDLRAVGNAQDAVVKAQQAVINAKQAVVDAVQAHTDALRNEAAAARATQQAYVDMTTAQAANTRSTDLSTAAGRANYKQAQDLIAADTQLGLSSQDLVSKFSDQESQLGLTSVQIYDTAKQTGSFNDNQMAQLTQHLLDSGVKGGDLTTVMQQLGVRLAALNGIKVNFDVNGVGSIDISQLYASLGYSQGDIKQIQQQTSQPGGPPQGSANALLHADGGAIHGPGGPRDDRVPALLSNGEHVWTASEVRAAGGHSAVERMRAAVQGYASGGAVTAADALSAAQVVALGQAKGTSADIGLAIASVLGNRSPAFLPNGGHTTLSILAPPTRAGSGVPGATLVGVIPQGQHKAIIDAALAADGIATSQWGQWEIGLNTLVGRESGWNPNAINRWDSNAKAGHPSQGLGQTIPGTFAAYRNKSLVNNILDPVANLAAVINYINADYHGIGHVQQANPALPPKGYDNGGWLTGLGVNTSGRPEAVLTADESAGLKAAVKSGPIRLDDYSIGKMAQAMVLASHERPIEVRIGSQPGLGLIV